MSSPAGEETIRLLITSGADVNITYNGTTNKPTNSTAFHDLVKFFPENVGLIKLCLDHGGDPNLISRNRTVLQSLLWAQAKLARQHEKKKNPEGKVFVKVQVNMGPDNATDDTKEQKEFKDEKNEDETKSPPEATSSTSSTSAPVLNSDLNETKASGICTFDAQDSDAKRSNPCTSPRVGQVSSQDGRLNLGKTSSSSPEDSQDEQANLANFMRLALSAKKSTIKKIDFN